MSRLPVLTKMALPPVTVMFRLPSPVRVRRPHPCILRIPDCLPELMLFSPTSLMVRPSVLLKMAVVSSQVIVTFVRVRVLVSGSYAAVPSPQGTTRMALPSHVSPTRTCSSSAAKADAGRNISTMAAESSRLKSRVFRENRLGIRNTPFFLRIALPLVQILWQHAAFFAGIVYPYSTIFRRGG